MRWEGEEINYNREMKVKEIREGREATAKKMKAWIIKCNLRFNNFNTKCFIYSGSL